MEWSQSKNREYVQNRKFHSQTCFLLVEKGSSDEKRNSLQVNLQQITSFLNIKENIASSSASAVDTSDVCFHITVNFLFPFFLQPERSAFQRDCLL